jgi:hypothetical protein
MNDDPAAWLKNACDVAMSDPKFQPDPEAGVTHCNQAVAYVAGQLGCHELDGLMADEQYQVMATNASGHWRKVDGSTATLHALDGGLAIAAMTSQRTGQAHGHVAVVYPEGMQASPSLGHDVPTLANVGRFVGVVKSSAAFPVANGEADYFVWN